MAWTERNENIKTADITSYLSTMEVSDILGVNVATVKRWTDSGKLSCVKTGGGHRKFQLKDITHFTQQNKKYAKRLTLLPLDNHNNQVLSEQIRSGNLDQLIPIIFERSIRGESSGIQSILNGLYMIHQDLVMIYSQLITPVLHKIGHLWELGALSITQEHIASQTIRDSIVKLQDIVVKPKEDAGRVFVLTLKDELHDIPAKMVQYLLEMGGFNVLYSGQKTPVAETKAIFELFEPKRVYLSLTYIQDPHESEVEISELIRLCHQYESTLFVGGAGLDHIRIPKEARVTKLSSLADVIKF